MTADDVHTFRATAVSALELTDVGVFAVVLAENADGSGARLEIQRAAAFDEQDEELGQDTYCVSTQHGVTHYGGVSAWRLTSRALELALDPAAAKALGGEPGFLVELVGVDAETLARLRDGLARVFVGVSTR